MKRIVVICILLCSWSVPAFPLVSVTRGGVTFTYPEGEDVRVSRMIEEISGILDFLESKGLPVTMPIQVILDDDLDRPGAVVHMIPHRKIRIPLRAPGVLEDGYLEQDPWTYFLFIGLCHQGIYAMRSGIPGYAHRAFGEVISPNLINPPWLLDGVSFLLYTQYRPHVGTDPFDQAHLRASIPSDMAKVSNHPGIWPGYFGYRIYGRPFISWLHAGYGWAGIHEFLEVHGAGIIPIEIDLKARQSFGKTWPALWREFISQPGHPPRRDDGRLIYGYVTDPVTTWDNSGVYPGLKRVRHRSRYGWLDDRGILWISEYDSEGVSKLVGYTERGITLSCSTEHLWDPGEGGVVVTREGSSVSLISFRMKSSLLGKTCAARTRIPAPEGALQLSGPVMNRHGHIAVAVNIGGNWDIWVYDTTWKRVTHSSSVEMDPWWDGDTLVFSSDVTGTFQIHTADLKTVTQCSHAGVLPRDGTYLCLTEAGWGMEEYVAPEADISPRESEPPDEQPKTDLEARPYSPIPSIWPNFLTPDLYAGVSDVQIGLATWGRDVTGDYTLNGGIRYSFHYDYVSLRGGAHLKDVGLQASRYPFVYEPELTVKTEESRRECRVYFRHHDEDWAELSLNRLDYEPLENFGGSDSELWAGLHLEDEFEYVRPWLTLEHYSGGRTSLFGGVRFLLGTEMYSTLDLQGGKTWSGYTSGHGSFRVGGETGEGYFTRRPSRLFALRGFRPNVLEARQAVSSALEVFWPLANLQLGYKTLPLFLHRLWLGSFIDAGACADSMNRDDVLVGAGFELVTSFEVAWGNLSSFTLGIAWPVRQPDYLDEEGPIFLLQVGRPL
ncbi:MAG: TolB family protein [Desulfomonilia bacterium]